MTEPKGLLVTPVGYDASGDPRSLEVDPDDHLFIAFETPHKGLVGAYGYYQGNWFRQPMPLGYSAIHREYIVDLTLSSGDSVHDTPAVAAGEIWRITNLSFTYIGTVPTHVQFEIWDGSDFFVIYRKTAPVSDVYYDRQGEWILEEDDVLRLAVVGATLNDDLIGYGLGVRIDIDL